MFLKLALADIEGVLRIFGDGEAHQQEPVGTDNRSDVGSLYIRPNTPCCVGSNCANSMCSWCELICPRS